MALSIILVLKDLDENVVVPYFNWLRTRIHVK